METLGDIGELKVIERICGHLRLGRDVRIGPGDDCAVVRVGQDSTEELLLTSDPVIQETHFSGHTPPFDIGHKAVGRALSDIAAMGGAPKWAVIDMVARADTPVSMLDGLCHGAMDLAAKHDLSIVGGDISSGPCLEMHVFGVGTAPVGRALLRSGSEPGDILCVTGSLGGSRTGRHLRIEPRIDQGIWLRDWASAAIDVSDGLASDLRHLTTMSGVGCELDCARVPIFDEAKKSPDDISPLDHALCDGEDFELLFTVPESRAAEFAAAWERRFDLSSTRIGVMTGEKGVVRCRTADGESKVLEGTGYTHFGGAM